MEDSISEIGLDVKTKEGNTDKDQIKIGKDDLPNKLFAMISNYLDYSSSSDSCVEDEES